jgi:hypothetical protein
MRWRGFIALAGAVILICALPLSIRGNMLVARAVWIAVEPQVQLGKALAGKSLA